MYHSTAGLVLLQLSSSQRGCPHPTFISVALGAVWLGRLELQSPTLIKTSPALCTAGGPIKLRSGVKRVADLANSNPRGGPVDQSISGPYIQSLRESRAESTSLAPGTLARFQLLVVDIVHVASGIGFLPLALERALKISNSFRGVS